MEHGIQHFCHALSGEGVLPGLFTQELSCPVVLHDHKTCEAQFVLVMFEGMLNFFVLGHCLIQLFSCDDSVHA